MFRTTTHITAAAAHEPSAFAPWLRGAAIALAGAAAFILAAGVAGAQTPVTGRGPIELRPYVGAVVPTGAQRDLLKDAVLVGAQLGWQFHRNVAVTGSFGWAPASDRTTAFAGNANTPGGLYTGREEDVDLFQYDVAVEGRLPNVLPSLRWSTRPYAALGVGGRTYNYRDVETVGAETNFVGFGALGLDVIPPTGNLGLRIEARDNVSAFKGLRGERDERKARNDVQFTAGLTFRL